MLDFLQRVKETKPKFLYLLAVRYAISETINGLDDYVDDLLDKVKRDIYSKIAGLPNCNEHCSIKHKFKFKDWCPTCSAVKRELKIHHRYTGQWEKTKWNLIDSSAIFYSNEELAKCFMKDPSTVGRTHTGLGVLKDFGNLMSLFRNLNSCDISSTNIEAVTRIRNRYSGHNYSETVHNHEKNECMNELLNLFANSSVRVHNSAKSAIEIISELQKEDNDLVKIMFESNTVSPNDVMTETEIGNLNYDERILVDKMLSETSKLNTAGYNKCFFELQLLLLIIIFVGCIYYWCFYRTPDTAVEDPNEDCLELKPSGPIGYTFDFLPYVQNLREESSIERTWLSEILLSKLHNNNKGIILAAEMGYGKSTLVSNILCAKKTSPWYSVRRLVISYHMCRFDHVFYNKPEVFIKMLAQTITSKYPEIGNIILTNEKALRFLQNDTTCADDPDTCLETIIINSMKNKKYQEKHVVIIDALDECHISFLNLLKRKIRYLPDVFRLIITTRYLEELIQSIYNVDIINLGEFEIKNKEDIAKYLSEKTNMDPRKINEFVNASYVNFLFTKLLLAMAGGYNNTNLPSSLNELFDINFHRIFENDYAKFSILRPVFEILCALYKPIPEDELIDIIRNPLDETERYLVLQMIGNELRHFVRKTKNEISLLHKSIGEFLTNSSRKHLKFYIYKENGHRLVGTYLLDKSNTTHFEGGFVELVYHVSLANNKTMTSQLIGLLKMLNLSDIKTVEKFPLHEAAREIKSYETIKLLHQILGKESESFLDDKHMTPAFIAASVGNTEAFRALLDIGVQMNALQQNDTFYISHYLTLEELIFHCKFVVFCGYNPLHIASQNGHFDIVKLILRKNRTIISSKTGNGLTAFQLASEQGHTTILKYMLQNHKTKPDFLSLHHAAMNGHVDVVKLLLNSGVNDQCLPCNGTRYWIQENETTEHRNLKMPLLLDNFMYGKSHYIETLVIQDDLHLLWCESALNAAVRKGHIDVVKAVLNSTKESLECANVFGRTPFLTSAQTQNFEIFRFLHKMGANSSFQCIDKSNIGKINSRNSYYLQLSSYACIEGASIEHVIAENANTAEIFVYAVKNMESLSWKKLDKFNLSPIHYAFCSSGTTVILGILKGIISPSDLLLSRSHNGSTPYHSWASCKSYALLDIQIHHNITKKYTKIDIPEVYDNDNRSILQYGILNHSPSENHMGWYLLLFINFIDTAGHNFRHVDSFGDNFLHYACLSGAHYVLADAMKRLSKEDFHEAIHQVNVKGIIPIEIAFTAMPQWHEETVINLPDGCPIYLIFTNHCSINVTELLSTHELCILIILEYCYVNESKNNCSFNFERLFSIAAEKSRLYPVLMLHKYAKVSLGNILTSSYKFFELMKKYKGPFILDLLINEKNSIECNNGKPSLIHEIVWKDRNVDIIIIYKLLKNFRPSFLDKCFDRQGFNLLHRAAMGGNADAITVLLSVGVDVFQKSSNNKTALEILVEDSPYLYSGNTYFEGSQVNKLRYRTAIRSEMTNYYRLEGPTDYDTSSVILLDKMTNPVNENRFNSIKQVLCPKDSKSIGVLHLAVAKGFRQLLERSKTLFGYEIQQCQNKYNISLYYLALLFKQDEIIKYFKDTRIKPVLPNYRLHVSVSAELAASDLFLDWTCKIFLHERFVKLQHHKIKICLRTIINLVISGENKLMKTHLKTIMKSRLTDLNTYSTTETYIPRQDIIRSYKKVSDKTRFSWFVCRAVRKYSFLQTETLKQKSKDNCNYIKERIAAFSVLQVYRKVWTKIRRQLIQLYMHYVHFEVGSKLPRFSTLCERIPPSFLACEKMLLSYEPTGNLAFIKLLRGRNYMLETWKMELKSHLFYNQLFSDVLKKNQTTMTPFNDKSTKQHLHFLKKRKLINIDLHPYPLIFNRLGNFWKNFKTTF